MSSNLLGLGVAQVASIYAVGTLAISIQEMTPQTALSVAMFSTIRALRSLLVQSSTLIS